MQLKVLIVPRKRKEDDKMSKTKSLLLVNLIEWEARGILTVENDVLMVEEEVVVAIVGGVIVASKEEDNKSDNEY